MKLTSLTIVKLFGTFNYEMAFSDTNTPFIITGLNGFGKTTILNILYHLAEKDFVYLYQLRFDSISVKFDNGDEFIITSTINTCDKKLHKNSETDTRLSNDHEVIYSYKNKDVLYRFTFNKVILLDLQAYVNRVTYEAGEYTDVLSEGFYQYIISNKQAFDSALKSEAHQAGAIYLFLEQIDILFIESQRLFTSIDNIYQLPYHYHIFAHNNEEDDVKDIETVIEISDALSTKIQKTIDNYLRKSDKIDAQWVDILYKMTKDQILTREEYEQKSKQIFEKVDRLQKFGLLETKPKLYEYHNSHSDVSTAFINTLEEKLMAYDSMLAKLELFDKLLSSLQFINKTIVYTRAKGLQIFSHINGQELSLKLLSTGEQNEIIMLYRMIFDINEHSVILIDEPENSLHVAWQNDYLSHIEEIALVKNMQIIVATHSPHIIGGRWEDCYDLTETWGNETK